MMKKTNKTPTIPVIPEEFRIYRYRFLFRTLTPLVFPHGHYPADCINGAFGQALREVVCLMNPAPAQPPCASCMLRTTCAFPFLMAVSGLSLRPLPRKYKDHPKPYVISAPDLKEEYAAGENLSFDITLMGSANERLGIVLQAMLQMGEAGVGTSADKSRDRRDRAGMLGLQWMSALYDEDTVVPLYASGSLIPGVEPRPWPLQSRDQDRKRNRITELHLLTPLSLPDKHPDDFSLNHLLKLAVNRIFLLSYVYCGTELPEKEFSLDETVKTEPAEKAIEQRSYLSSSRKHGNRYPLHGWTGVLSFGSAISPWIDILKLGGMVHTGQGSAGGLGYFTVK